MIACENCYRREQCTRAVLALQPTLCEPKDGRRPTVANRIVSLLAENQMTLGEMATAIGVSKTGVTKGCRLLAGEGAIAVVGQRTVRGKPVATYGLTGGEQA